MRRRRGWTVPDRSRESPGMPISEYLRAMREKVGSAPVMMIAVCALIFDERDRILLHRAADDGRWHTIGGAIDPHEEPAGAAVRGAREEAGRLGERGRRGGAEG